jgi:hypothetical protein
MVALVSLLLAVTFPLAAPVTAAIGMIGSWRLHRRDRSRGMVPLCLSTVALVLAGIVDMTLLATNALVAG